MSLKRVFSHSVIYSVSNILSKSIAFFLIPIYTRFLTTSEFGVLSLATVVSTLLMNFYQFGQSGALQKFFYDFEGKNRKNLIGNIFLFEVIFVFSLAIILSLFGKYIFEIFLSDVGFFPYLLIAVWSAALTAFGFFPQVLLRIEKRPVAYSTLLVSRFFVTNIAIIFLVVFLKLGVLGALVGSFISAIIYFVIYIFYTIKRSEFSIDTGKIKMSLLFGLPLVPHAVSGWVLTFVDRFMIERFVGLSQLGIYSLGYNLGLAMSIIVTSINLAWVPFFFETVKEKREKAPAIFSKIIVYYTFFLVFLTLAMSALSRELVVLLSTEGYYAAASILPIIVLSYAFQGMYFIAVNPLFLKSKTVYIATVTTFTAGLNFLLNLYLIPKFEIAGAAWATLISYVVFFAVIYFISQKFYPVFYNWKKIFIVAATGCVLYVITLFINIENIYLSGTIKLLIIAIFPALLYFLGFFTKSDLTYAKNLIERYGFGKLAK